MTESTVESTTLSWLSKVGFQEKRVIKRLTPFSSVL